MTDSNVLDCKIYELKEVQRVAWRQLADSSLTAFERREIRNQIRLSNNELRQYLQMMSERLRSRVRSPEEGTGGSGKPYLRLLTLDEPPWQPFERRADLLLRSALTFSDLTKPTSTRGCAESKGSFLHSPTQRNVVSVSGLVRANVRDDPQSEQRGNCRPDGVCRSASYCALDRRHQFN
jgi:hypothetical protein